MTIPVTSQLQPWKPGADQPWNLRRVWHLHRRAGFAATWSELQNDLRAGPDAAIERLVRPADAGGPSEAGGRVDEFEQMSSVICEAAVASNNINRLKAWWMYRMLNSPDPLGERLTLMWHNHFATSNLKVENVGLMREQNELMRRHARSSFSELLGSMAKDPALLVWLDADGNRKEHPNENLAREIMELFSLGVGNYSEEDIREAARALTGWTVSRDRFRSIPDRHDDGEKTIFEETGKWTGDDFVQLLIKHPATPRRIAFRICELLMGESTIDSSLVSELADGLLEHDLDVGWGVEALLRSQAFFDEENIGNRILSPSHFVIGAVRALELTDPPPSTLLLAEWTARLGHDLFYPPNVFGWPGGRAWLSSRTMIGRANFVSSLSTGLLNRDRAPFDGIGLAECHGIESVEDRLTFFGQLLLGQEEPPAEFRGTGVESMALKLLASPYAQLG